MLQPPLNNLIIKVHTKYIRNISNIMKMSSVQKESRLNPADMVNIIGEIVAIPKAISKDRQYEGFSLKDIRIGDKAMFSHLVIFSFNDGGPNDDPSYKNMFYYRGQEYFVCNIQHLYAVIRDGEIIMVNGYAMIYDFDDPKIVLATSLKKKISISSSELMHIGCGKENNPELWQLTQEDTVIFPPTKTTKYQISEKPFRIIQQSHILGKIVGTGQVV